MAEITEGACQQFVRDEIKSFARGAVEQYYLAKRILDEWFGRNMGSIIGVS